MPLSEKYEYRLKIEAFSPDTMPLSRLAQYLGDLAKMMGEVGNVHLSHLEKGSTVPVVLVDYEAQPKVRDRLQLVRHGEGPLEALRAYKDINKRLVEDNANGALLDRANEKIIRFPGRDAANQTEFAGYSQQDFFQGVPIKLGGEGELVPVHLEDGDDVHIVHATRRVAKEIAPHLFTTNIRVNGRARWARNRLGDWNLLDFRVSDFDVLDNADLRESLAKLRGVSAAWTDLADPLGYLSEIKNGRN